MGIFEMIDVFKHTALTGIAVSAFTFVIYNAYLKEPLNIKKFTASAMLAIVVVFAFKALV